MSNEQTVSCPCCNNPYVVSSMYVGDQSVCPSCRVKSVVKGDATVLCRCCGEPYATFSMYAGDQSACPSCRTRARCMSQFIPRIADFTIDLRMDSQKDCEFVVLKRRGQSLTSKMNW